MEERCDHCEHFYLHGFYPWCSQLHEGLIEYEPCLRFEALEAASGANATLTPHPDTLRLEKLQSMVQLQSAFDYGCHKHVLLLVKHYEWNETPPESFDLRAYIDNLEE